MGVENKWWSKDKYKRYSSPDDFAQDFIEYHNLTPSERTKIDKQKRANKNKHTESIH